MLLPDDRFFSTVVPLSTEGDAGTVSEQVELALEALSPFPVAQLYHGYFTRPGATRALAFAAYRKRFTTDETATWEGMDLVTPAFAALLAAPAPEGATTWVQTRADGLTAVYFDDASGVPAAVRTCVFAADAGEPERVAARTALLREFAGSRSVVDLTAPEPQPSVEGELAFKSAGLQARIDEASAPALDVRDKADLAALQRSRVRDRWLWRTVIGVAAVIALCALSELALLGGKAWLATREATIAAQAPRVAEVMTKQMLATRIEELASKRLLPLEMISTISSAKPPSIQFLNTSTNGLYTMAIQAQTSAQGEIDVFQSALNQLGVCERVEVQDLNVRSGVSTFTLTVTFKPDAVRPASVPAS